MLILNIVPAIAVFILFCLKLAAPSEVSLAAKLNCQCRVLANSEDGLITLRKMKTVKVGTPPCYVPTWLNQNTIEDYQCHIAQSKCERKCRQKSNEVFYRRGALTDNKKILKKAYICRKLPNGGDYTLQVQAQVQVDKAELQMPKDDQYRTCKKKLLFDMNRITC